MTNMAENSDSDCESDNEEEEEELQSKRIYSSSGLCLTNLEQIIL